MFLGRKSQKVLDMLYAIPHKHLSKFFKRLHPREGLKLCIFLFLPFTTRSLLIILGSIVIKSDRF